MTRLSPGILCAAVLLAGAATFVLANPYQSRLDREYKSLSNAITRAYSPPPPPPTRSYSAPSYSSSSSYNRSSSSPSSSRSSYSGGGSPASTSYSRANTYAAESRRTAAQLAQEKREAEAKLAAAKKAKSAAVKRTVPAPSASAPKVRARSPDDPIYTAAEWATLRERTAGKAPLVSPPERAFESRRTEFAYFERIVRDNPRGTPWENMRLGQMCLAFEGNGAEPARAEAYFLRSNPDWPEVRLGLGLIYLRGLGVAADPRKGREHLERAYALASGAPKSARFVGNGAPPRDIAFEAAYELAVAYDQGRGLPADPGLALTWFARAEERPLGESVRKQIAAMRIDLMKRSLKGNPGQTAEFFAAATAAGTNDFATATLEELGGAADAPNLFQAGESIEVKDRTGDLRAVLRTKLGLYLAAARLGHEGAARAFFSPLTSNVYYADLSGRDSYWRDHLEFARQHWPAWEKKWLAAAQAGDASAYVPLAYYYSGARGNPADEKRALQYAAKLPASLPAAQRRTIETAMYFSTEREGMEWARTVWTAFGADFKTIDLDRHAKQGEPGRAEALRDEGNALAATDLKQARDRWRDAAVLGDLPAQVQLLFYALRNFGHLGEYYVSLQRRLEAAAAAGDPGATAVLAVLLGGGPGSDRRIGSALYETGQLWRAKAIQLAPHKARFTAAAKDPACGEDQWQEVRAAVLRETESWRAVERKWGLGGLSIMNDVTLGADDLRAADALREQFNALAVSARQLTERLPLWEATVAAGEFNPEADARFVQAHESWIWADAAEVDLPAAVDYLTQSVGLGHPIAPLAIAYFFGSGHGGFPQDAAVSRRFRALADARLTALAGDGDPWAAVMLGTLLLEPGERVDAAASPGRYEWLPHDADRALAVLGPAALEGAVLPRSFGDASGQTLAFYLSSRSDNELTNARWNLIDELYRSIDPELEKDRARWIKARTCAGEVLVEDAAVTRARLELDAKVSHADDGAPAAAAHMARAEARLAAKLPPEMARFNASYGCSVAPELPAAWRLVARVEEACGEVAVAAACLAVAQVLTGEAGAVARFEAAYQRINAEEQKAIRLRFEILVEEKPDHAMGKVLLAVAQKHAKPEER